MQANVPSRNRRPMRPALLDVVARSDTDASWDGPDFLAQLRELIAAVETPADRLLARYRGRPLAPAVSSGRYRD